MAQIVVPDETLIREPNLLVPGRKPVGPVKIDWSHPLARSALYAFIWQAAQPHDLVTNRIIGTTNATAVASKVDQQGRYLDHSGYLGVESSYSPFASIGTKDFTLFGKLRRGGISDENYLSSRNGFSDNHIRVRVNGNASGADPGDMSFRAGDTTSDIDTTGTSFENLLVDDGWHTFAFVYAGNVQTIYIDGQFCKSRTETRDDLSGTPTFTFGGISSLGTTSQYTGDRSIDMAWSRALSASEIAALHRNPYQFLIPA